jgi:hypothetical protein
MLDFITLAAWYVGGLIAATAIAFSFFLFAVWVFSRFPWLIWIVFALAVFAALDSTDRRYSSENCDYESGRGGSISRRC